MQEQKKSETVLKSKNKENWSIKEFFIFIIITIAVVFPIRLFIAQPFIVNGASMSPTFETGQYLIVDQLTYNLKDPQRGDVVIFKFPQDTSKYFIKRIIGLPEETLKLDGNTVTIFDKNKNEENKIVLNEPYIRFDKESYSEITLASDQYFVMGDNRLESLDSRIWGPVKREYIVGRALVRLLPLTKINLFPGEFEFEY